MNKLKVISVNRVPNEKFENHSDIDYEITLLPDTDEMFDIYLPEVYFKYDSIEQDEIYNCIKDPVFKDINNEDVYCYSLQCIDKDKCFNLYYDEIFEELE